MDENTASAKLITFGEFACLSYLAHFLRVTKASDFEREFDDTV